MFDYQPAKWFWIVAGNEDHFWSSSVGAYVDALPDDAGVTHIASESELTDVLAVYGLPGPIVRPQDVDAERDRRTASGFIFDGIAYQLDDRSQANVTAMSADARFAVLAGSESGNLRWADPDNDFGWIATDNETTPMDAQTMTAFGDAAKLWVSRHVFAARLIKNMNPIPSDFAKDANWPSQG